VQGGSIRLVAGSAEDEEADGDQDNGRGLWDDDGYDDRDDSSIAWGSAAGGAPSGGAEIDCGGSEHVGTAACGAGLLRDAFGGCGLKDSDDELRLVDEDGGAFGAGVGDVAEPVGELVARLGAGGEGDAGIGRDAVTSDNRRDAARVGGTALDEEVVPRRLGVGAQAKCADDDSHDRRPNETATRNVTLSHWVVATHIIGQLAKPTLTQAGKELTAERHRS